MKSICMTLLCTASLLMTGCSSAKRQVSTTDLPRGEANAELCAAVDSFVTATRQRPVRPDSIQLHSIMVLKHGQVLIERWFNGESAQKPHPMYSVSKTFTAAAVGMAIREGRLALTDKVVSFFPDKAPAEVSDNLSAMSIRDLLTMTCGHEVEPRAGVNADSVDWVQGFLAHPVVRQPGTYFVYNSIGTYMLSAILQKVTGQKLVDYLDERLFQPLHIERPVWDESPQGINCGGWGLNLKTEDMAKMGQCLLQGGQWNGQQLIPAEWVKEMSSYQVPCGPAGTPLEDLERLNITPANNDWTQGYGYQMWRCRHNAFRADGYAGQYIMIFPDRDAVLVLTTRSSLYQPYLDLIWEYLLPVL